MPPKKRSKPTVQAAPEASFDWTRSVYGDRHAAADNALIAAHAQHLQSAGVIDEHMVDELTKPYSRSHVYSVRYTTDYLALHPDYTGDDVDLIPTLQTAKKRQRDEDEAENRILEDYRAGHIDIWGNWIGGMMAGSDGASMSRIYQIQRPSSWDEEEDRDTTGGESSSENFVEHRRRINHLRKDSTEVVISHPSKLIANLSTKASFSTTAPLQFKKRIAQFRYNPDLLASSITSAANPRLNNQTSYDHASGTTPNEAIAISSSPPRPSPQRSRQARAVAPLAPSHDNSDYTEIDYYKAAALCRKRGIPSGGNLQEVRNHLIRDDTAQHEGSPRVLASMSYRRTYRTVAPGGDETVPSSTNVR